MMTFCAAVELCWNAYAIQTKIIFGEKISKTKSLQMLRGIFCEEKNFTLQPAFQLLWQFELGLELEGQP